MLANAYRIEIPTITITKVYPFNEDILEPVLEQQQPSNKNCIRNVYRCNFYTILYAVCLPCITTNVCIYLCCSICKCNTICPCPCIR